MVCRTLRGLHSFKCSFSRGHSWPKKRVLPSISPLIAMAFFDGLASCPRSSVQTQYME
jgi:hypothetical protein